MGSGFSTCQGESATSIRGSQALGDASTRRGLKVSIKSAWDKSRKLERGDARVAPVETKPNQGFHINFHPPALTSNGIFSKPESSRFGDNDVTDSFNLDMPNRTRPKSAHVRRHPGSASYVRETTNGRVRPRIRKAARLEEVGGDSLESSDEEMDSDLLSIPDETLFTPRTKMKHTAQISTAQPSQPMNTEEEVVEQEDWWDTLSPLESDFLTDRSHGSFVSRKFYDNSMGKKASERSISSVILLTPIESPSHTAANSAANSTLNTPLGLAPITMTMNSSSSASTPPSARAVLASNPTPTPSNITDQESTAIVQVNGYNSPQLRNFRKQLAILEEHLSPELATLSQNPGTGINNYHELVSKSRQLFLRAVTDLRQTAGRPCIGPESIDVSHLQGLENSLAQALYSAKDDGTVSQSVASHLKALDTLCDSEIDHIQKIDQSLPQWTLVDVEEGSESSKLSKTDDRGATMSNGTRARTCVRRPNTDQSLGSDGETRTKKSEVREGKFAKSRPDSGIAVSSATYSSSDEARERELDVASDTDWITSSLGMLPQVLAVRTEQHESMKSLVKEITKSCNSDQLKAHALYRWLSSQHLGYYRYASGAKTTMPTTKLRQLAEGKLTYASLYQEIARAAGLRCEKIDGYVKGKDFKPGMPIQHPSNQHSWNAVSLNGHYALIDVQYGSLPYKFFVEHFFMTPPDEFRLSHFPKDKKWLLMTQGISMSDFDRTLKTWPAMFAFNIRPLNMHSVLRTYDGRLSITVLLSNVAVTPMLEYEGPGPHIDSDTLAFIIDQEIRNVDSAETFHMTLSQEGVYYFTLMVHDIEEDKDIPALQYRIEYMDELL